MNLYVASWYEGDAEFCVSFDAEDWTQAEAIAEKRGWDLQGQYVDEVECEPEVEAMIENYIHNPVKH